MSVFSVLVRSNYYLGFVLALSNSSTYIRLSDLSDAYLKTTLQHFKVSCVLEQNGMIVPPSGMFYNMHPMNPLTGGHMFFLKSAATAL